MKEKKKKTRKKNQKQRGSVDGNIDSKAKESFEPGKDFDLEGIQSEESGESVCDF